MKPLRLRLTFFIIFCIMLVLLQQLVDILDRQCRSPRRCGACGLGLMMEGLARSSGVIE